LFTPNLSELALAGENTRQSITKLGLLLLLKSFQKLGYFVRLKESFVRDADTWKIRLEYVSSSSEQSDSAPTFRNEIFGQAVAYDACYSYY
jgi:hypothetical protein